MTRSVCRLFRSPRPSKLFDSDHGRSTAVADRIPLTSLAESQFDEGALTQLGDAVRLPDKR
jgi:hypothetical protein